MSKYLDNLDVIDANGLSINVLIKDRETDTLKSEIGVLSELTTTDKSSLVASINEVNTGLTYLDTTKVGNLSNLTTDVKDSIVGAINSVKTDADNASDKVGNLSDLITVDKRSAVIAINEVANTVQRITSVKKYVILSDSYGVTPSNADNWIVDFCTIMGLTVGTNAFHYSEGGASFGGTDSYPLFKDMINNITIVGATDSEITDIICCAGYNDIAGIHGASSETIATGIANFATNARTRFPNATIHIGFIAGTLDGSLRASMAAAINAYIVNSNLNKCHYLNNVEHAMYLDTMYQGDKIHPYSAGAASMANAVVGAILTGSADIKTEYKNATFVASSGVTLVTFSWVVGSKVDNGELMVNFFYNTDSCQFTFSPAVDIANEIELGTISDTHVFGDDFNTLSCLVAVDAGGTNYLSNVPARLSIRSGKVYIKIFGTLTDMNGLVIKGSYAVTVSQIEQ